MMLNYTFTDLEVLKCGVVCGCCKGNTETGKQTHLNHNSMMHKYSKIKLIFMAIRSLVCAVSHEKGNQSFAPEEKN